jgi:fructokinase
LARRTGDDTSSVCPFHDNCVEGLTSGPGVARRLKPNQALESNPVVLDLVAHYLGELAATLVLAWSPERIVWGGGVMATPQLLERLRAALHEALAGYSVGDAVMAADFCVPPGLENSGLEGALLMAKNAPAGVDR